MPVVHDVSRWPSRVDIFSWVELGFVELCAARQNQVDNSIWWRPPLQVTTQPLTL